MVAVKSLADAATLASLKTATGPVYGAPTVVTSGVWALASGTGSAKTKSSVTTRLWPLTGSSPNRPGWNVVPLKLNSTSVPRVSVTLVMTGLANTTPRNSAAPDAEGCTKNLPRLVVPAKYSILVGLGKRTLRKMAPKPGVAAGTGAVPAGLGRTKLISIVFSPNMANVLVGLKAGNSPVTLGLTVEKVDGSAPEAGPLTA